MGCVPTHGHQQECQGYIKMLWGLSSAVISSLHSGIRPPEMDITSPKTAYGCPCGVPNKTDTCTILSPYGVHLSVYSCVCVCLYIYIHTHHVTPECSAGQFYNSNPLASTLPSVNKYKAAFPEFFSFVFLCLGVGAVSFVNHNGTKGPFQKHLVSIRILCHLQIRTVQSNHHFFFCPEAGTLSSVEFYLINTTEQPSFFIIILFSIDRCFVVSAQSSTCLCRQVLCRKVSIGRCFVVSAQSSTCGKNWFL